MDCEFEACLGYVTLAVGGEETETETTEGRREEEGKKERVRKKEGREKESGRVLQFFFLALTLHIVIKEKPLPPNPCVDDLGSQFLKEK